MDTLAIRTPHLPRPSTPGGFAGIYTPAIRTPHPSVPLAILGGLVATLLLSALTNLAPVFGFPFIDFPRLTGGIFTANPVVAFWLGYWIFFFGGVLGWAPLLTLFWPALPGHNVRFRGALVKGLLWGLILWVVSGLLLPVAGIVNQLADQGLNNPGFFALEQGHLAAAGLLLGHLLYGIALALVAAMGQGISPFDTIGWMWSSHGSGESP